MSSEKLRPLPIYANVMSDISKHEAYLESSDAKKTPANLVPQQVRCKYLYINII